MTNKVLYIAKMYEDGKVHLTEPFETIKEAKAAGKGRWLSSRFDVIEIVDNPEAHDPNLRLYEAIRHIID